MSARTSRASGENSLRRESTRVYAANSSLPALSTRMGEPIVRPVFRRLAQLAGLLLLTLCLAGCQRNASDASSPSAASSGSPSDQFLRLMNAGKNYQDQGDATNALAVYGKAEAIAPNDVDLRLNLANCYLLSDAADKAVRAADELLKLEPNSA